MGDKGMQAIAVRPGEPWSLHRTAVDLPPLTSIPDGRGVQVRVLQVGLCGTDAEIAEGLFGYPPPGEPSLVLGHEHLGQVIAAGPAVTEPGLQPGRLVVASNRRPGRSPWDAIGLQDFTADLDTRECGIRGVRGFLVEQYVEDARFLTPVPDALLEVGVLTEPMSVVEKGLAQAWAVQRRLHVWEPHRALVVGSGTIGLLAVLALRLRGIETVCVARRRSPTRNTQLVADAGAQYVSLQDSSLAETTTQGPFDLVIEASGAAEHLPTAAGALAPNGVLVLASVTSAPRIIPVDLAAWNQAFVLWNRAMVGTVNSAPTDWTAAVGRLAEAATVLPGWTARLLTTRIDGLDPDAIRAHLEGHAHAGAIKTVVHLADPLSAPGG
jgi:threonine dehydrogenase-like Zn-dependent dehydrogenase